MLSRVSMLVVLVLLVTSLRLSDAISASPNGGLLVVANQREHTVLVVDPEARRELARVVEGVNGHEVNVSADRRFPYVPIYGNSRVGRAGTHPTKIQFIN